MILTSLLAKSQDDRGSFYINGYLKNTPSQTVYLINFRNKNIVDSAKVSSTEGLIMLSGSASEERSYYLRFSKKGGILVLAIAPKDSLVLYHDLDNYWETSIKGAVAAKEFLNFNLAANEQGKRLRKIESKIDSMENIGANEDDINVEKNALKLMNIAFHKQNKELAYKTPSPVTASFILANFIIRNELDDLEDLLKHLESKFSRSSYLPETISTIKSKIKASNTINDFSAVTYAPEINALDLKGQPFNLKSLRGKYVLIEFWASWCKPCRAEFPILVKTYNEYKDRNFTILGVSLDSGKEDWIEAIKTDNLTWIHVSDLKGWKSAAAQVYKVNAIPQNFLIDPEGKIIAMNLRGDGLKKKLKEIFK
ncbi:Thiol-disulfide isomerase or thioredoxin [Solitalea koreensis]|uniref:Thiol-disulfide isomerase or thioredoxin n=2 Tax=Solitalea koreensis TaxID=543615 RepID=A0A521DD54_9SPHI|nr:Thiol-disulfide isomerase or thioredoxin [Solitalea koreensis]